ncbi:MAG: lysylphosphatidylglycerol synthase domain-containing protein [Gemmatimonadales bacterium]
MSRGFWRAVQVILAVAILFFVGLEFWRNWEEVRSTPLVWTPRPGLLLLSAGVTWVMYGLLIAAWRGFLVAWRQPIGAIQAARIWSLSNLGKYVPGKVWAIAGMAVMARQAGVAAWAATASAILLQGLAIGTGAFVVGITASDVLETAWPGTRLVLWILALASAIGVGALVSPGTLRLVLRRFVPDQTIPRPGAGTIGFGILANLTAWGGYGLAFWLMSRGLLPETPLTLLVAVGAFTASYLAGFLALLAPGGLGVREAVFVLILQGSVGLTAAAALAVASRVLLTLTEVGIAVPFLVHSSRGSVRTT